MELEPARTIGNAHDYKIEAHVNEARSRRGIDYFKAPTGDPVFIREEVWADRDRIHYRISVTDPLRYLGIPRTSDELWLEQTEKFGDVESVSRAVRINKCSEQTLFLRLPRRGCFTFTVRDGPKTRATLEDDSDGVYRAPAEGASRLYTSPYSLFETSTEYGNSLKKEMPHVCYFREEVVPWPQKMLLDEVKAGECFELLAAKDSWTYGLEHRALRIADVYRLHVLSFNPKSGERSFLPVVRRTPRRVYVKINPWAVRLIGLVYKFPPDQR